MRARPPARTRIGLTVLDAVIIGLVLGGSGLLAWRVYADSGLPPVLHIKAAGGEWYYPLDRDRELLVHGPLGDTRVVIAHGEAWFAESPCPEKTCLRFPRVRRNGEWINCLPNMVLATVEGRREAAYDAESF